MMRNYALVPLRQCMGPKNPLAGYFRCFSSSNPSGSDTKVGNHVPNLVDKYLLVWMKKYPSVKDVPNRITSDQMEKVRNWARIKINIAACIGTVFACIYMIKLGKDAVKRGESIQKINQDWHKSQSEK